MSGKDKFERSLTKVLGDYQQATKGTPAVLGNGYGVVSVPSRPNYVFARAGGQILQVFNGRGIPLVQNIPVFIGYDLTTNPDVLQVLSMNLSSSSDGIEGDATYPATTSHVESHEWMNPTGGSDIVFVQQRQILPLRIAAMTGTQTVFNYRGFVPDLEGGWSSLDQVYIDLSGTAPTGTLARYMLISALPSGELLITTGSIKSKSSLFLSDIPEQEFGTYPLAAVRVYGQQDQGIQETLTDTDIVDLRWFPHIRSSGTVGIYDNDIFEGNVRNINFVGGLDVHITGTFANISWTGTASGGGTGSTVSIYEDSVFVTEVGSISFEDDIEVTHTGSVAFVSHVNCGTYQRVGQPVPLLSVTGAYWRILEGTYATGSLSVFIDGIIQLPIIDFDEFIPISGTYHYADAPPTGSVHVTMWGVPCQDQPYIITGTAITGLRDSDGVLMLDSDGNQLQDSDGA